MSQGTKCKVRCAVRNGKKYSNLLFQRRGKDYTLELYGRTIVFKGWKDYKSTILKKEDL